MPYASRGEPTEERRARDRYASKMRARGTPLLVGGEEFEAAARLLARAREYGMSDRMIADQTGIPMTVPSKVRRGAIKAIRRSTLDKLMTLKPERPAATYSEAKKGNVPAGPYVDPTGTVRRIRALRADGFPGRFLASRLGATDEAISQLARVERSAVYRSRAQEVAALYRELAGRRPEEFGYAPHNVARCRTVARDLGFAPRGCWDPVTIDDPEAEPDWTGHCGTPLGRWIHERDDIPKCDRCKKQPHKIPFSGEKFRALREKKGLSQREVESLAGLAKGHVHHWEAGRYTPRPGILNRVLDLLDATYEDVCEVP